MVDMTAPFIPPVPSVRQRGLLIDAVSGGIPDRWLGGISGTPLGCSTGERAALDFCDYDDGTVPETEPDGRDLVTFQPFQVYFFESCSSLGSTPTWLADRVRARARAHASFHLAAELVSATDTDNPDFSDAFDLGSGTVQRAMAAIEGALAQRLHGGAGVIHVPPSLLAELDYDIAGDTPTGAIYSPSGHRIVADAGYESSTADSVAEFGAGTIYGSGPIMARWTDPRPIGESGQRVSLTRNTQSAVAVSEAILAFDPCTLVAADYTHS